ncbi:hypothetical protein Q7P37_006012 [Cladosporium fusiforme]
MANPATDPSILPFLNPTFDPATYLNNTLPSLSLARNPPPGNANLTDLSTQTQTLLTQLNASTARLSNTLTQLTDEIIRTGGRLAYEVEVLRSETTGLTDSLESGKENGLKREIELLAPARKGMVGDEDKNAQEEGFTPAAPSSSEPSHLPSLRELSTLRTRLDSVIRIFGAATAWPAEPAPNNNNSEAESQKAKDYTEALQAEISTLLSNNDLAAAVARVEELRALAEVWKGTAEEKARGRVVEGLGKMVEERRESDVCWRER